MAATTLVAEISESRKDGSSEEMLCLMECLRTMKEMEHTEIVAKNVYNIVQTIMRVCNVKEDTFDLESVTTTSVGAAPPPPPAPQRIESLQATYEPPVGLNQTTLAMWPAFDFEGIDMEDGFPFAFEQQVPSSEPPGMLPPMDPYLQMYGGKNHSI